MLHSHLRFFVANRPENFLRQDTVSPSVLTRSNSYLGSVSKDGDVVNILGLKWSETIISSVMNGNFLSPRGGEKISRFLGIFNKTNRGGDEEARLEVIRR